MKLEKMTLTDVRVLGLESVWRWRWDEATPWPELGAVRAQTFEMHGHWHLDMGGVVVNVPYHSVYPFSDIPSLGELRAMIAPVVQQLVESKETLLHDLFGGVVVNALAFKNWREDTDGSAADDANPIGLDVFYTRFSKSGVLLPGYMDQAMWERNPLKRSELYETHRGPVPAAQASEFNQVMSAIWVQIKGLILQQERGVLGL